MIYKIRSGYTMSKEYSLETNLVQAGNGRDPRTGAVNLPIHMSTAYRHTGIGESTGYDYTRTGNPTREALEETIAVLEGGSNGFAFASGMAAIQSVCSLFKSGDHILASHDLYGGSYRLFNDFWTQWNVTFDYTDMQNLEKVESGIKENTKALFVETPTNPQMQEADLTELGNLARKYSLLLIVDNTFYTPIIQRPIEYGADIVVHSATKYLGGHNDLLAGLVVTKNAGLGEKIYSIQNGIGMTLGAFDSWLLVRGLKTLKLRMDKHTENAQKIAKFLNNHDLVEEVLYPGKGGMLSFRLISEELVDGVLRNLKLITFAESLGGVESLMTYPTVQTHADMPEEVRKSIGIDDTLLRLSVGIESAEDLIHDLDQALLRAK